jgi:hypothetical protein
MPYPFVAMSLVHFSPAAAFVTTPLTTIKNNKLGETWR